MEEELKADLEEMLLSTKEAADATKEADAKDAKLEGKLQWFGKKVKQTYFLFKLV